MTPSTSKTVPITQYKKWYISVYLCLPVCLSNALSVLSWENMKGAVLCKSCLVCGGPLCVILDTFSTTGMWLLLSSNKIKNSWVLVRCLLVISKHYSINFRRQQQAVTPLCVLMVWFLFALPLYLIKAEGRGEEMGWEGVSVMGQICKASMHSATFCVNFDPVQLNFVKSILWWSKRDVEDGHTS